MATVWKGAINFGLINIPVKLFTATKKETPSFRMLHNECKSPINQKRWCNSCEKEVAYEDTTKGYEYEKGSFVEITEEDLKSIPVKSAKYIQIVDFIKLGEVDSIYFDKAYYLSPEKSGEKPYFLLLDAMNETKRVAVAKIALREREHLCLIKTYENILLLNTMYFYDEIQSTADISKTAKKAEVSLAETSMAKQLIENLTAPFEPEKYHDEYRNALQKMIEQKITGEEIYQPSINEPANAKFADLLEKLKQSVAATAQGTSKPAKDKIKEKKSKNTLNETSKKSGKAKISETAIKNAKEFAKNTKVSTGKTVRTKSGSEKMR